MNRVLGNDNTRVSVVSLGGKSGGQAILILVDILMILWLLDPYDNGTEDDLPRGR